MNGYHMALVDIWNQTGNQKSLKGKQSQNEVKSQFFLKLVTNSQYSNK